MFSEKMQSRHLTELGTIKRYMDDIEIESVLLKKGDVFPLHSLVIDVENDYKNRQRHVTLNFVPIDDNEFEYIHLLQFYTILLFKYEEQYKSDVEQLILYINRLTAIGDFGLRGDSEIDFRYVYTASLEDIIPQAQISETLILYVFMLDIYAKMLEAVGTGERTLQDVIKELINIQG